jgi:hypothetical protein
LTSSTRSPRRRSGDIRCAIADVDDGARCASGPRAICTAGPVTWPARRALNPLGWNYAQIGDHQQALVHCGKAVPLHHESGDRSGAPADVDGVTQRLRTLATIG